VKLQPVGPTIDLKADEPEIQGSILIGEGLTDLSPDGFSGRSDRRFLTRTRLSATGFARLPGMLAPHFPACAI